MKTQLLGQSGLRVSELCLGTMTFGEERHLDTANVYTDGTSEKLGADRRDREQRRRHAAVAFAQTQDRGVEPDDRREPPPPRRAARHRRRARFRCGAGRCRESELADSLTDQTDQGAREAMKEYRRIALPADAIARAIADAIAYAIAQPDDVDVSEIIVRPTAGAN